MIEMSEAGNNCLKCIYREKAGSNTIHSKCTHPVVDNIMSDHDALGIIFKNFANENRVTSGLWGLSIDVEQGAVIEGWCYWPFNFDPRWVNSCSGCTPRED
jgi:hypothetical protein